MKLNKYDLHRALRGIPKELKQHMRGGTVFVGGGYLTSVVRGDKVNDIDVFVGSKAEAEELSRSLKAKLDITNEWKSDNAITLRRPGRPPIQIIHRWTFKKIKDVADSFDFTICCAAIGYEFGPSGVLEVRSYCDPAFYQDVAANRLVYRHPIRNEDAGGSMLRLLKYYRKGYSAPLTTTGGVIARMLAKVDWQHVNTHHGAEREEFLTRVLTGLLVEVDPNSDPEAVLAEYNQNTGN